MREEISTLANIPKDKYTTIIWDISNQQKECVLSGKAFCQHKFVKKVCALCGAYKGFIRDLPIDDLRQKILLELALSPSIDNTFIFLNRDIGRECELKSPMVSTPRYKIFTWLNCYGDMFKGVYQKELFLIHNTKQGKYLSQSKYIVNKKQYDLRLLGFGKTLFINPKPKWIVLSDSIDYLKED